MGWGKTCRLYCRKDPILYSKELNNYCQKFTLDDHLQLSTVYTARSLILYWRHHGTIHLINKRELTENNPPLSNTNSARDCCLLKCIVFISVVIGFRDSSFPCLYFLVAELGHLQNLIFQDQDLNYRNEPDLVVFICEKVDLVDIPKPFCLPSIIQLQVV